MSIWHFDETARDPEFVWQTSCPFCCEALRLIYRDPFDDVGDDVPFDRSLHSLRTVEICDSCGWWKASDFREYASEEDGTAQRFATWGACASLKELDLTDIRTPMKEVRDYLTVAYNKRFELDPARFEDAVGSVFSSLGYQAIVTGKSGDRGIDVILERGSERIGVQVKRYSNSIGVEQLRSLAGSLLLNQILKGIFVTTSRFQSGVRATVDEYEVRGYRIELYDAERFYGALKEAQGGVLRSTKDIDVRRCLEFVKQLDARKVAVGF